MNIPSFQRLTVVILVGILAASMPSLAHGQTPSTDATLSGLTVGPKDIIGFQSDHTDYAVGVANTVTTVTVVAARADSNSRVEYSSEDADGNTEGHQVNLDVGLNSFTITVTAEDGVTTREYKLDIGRGSTAPLGWKSQDDLNGLIAVGNESPNGIWGNSTTIWIVDNIDNKVYAYNQDGTLDAEKEIALDPKNSHASGIGSDGTTMWVSDRVDDKLYAYVLDGGARDEAKDISVATLAQSPAGIWTNEATLWVLDARGRWIYAYHLSDRTRDPSRDLNVRSDTLSPVDIWSDGATMWVSSGRLRAWDLDTGARTADRDIVLPGDVGLTRARNIWSDGVTLWVSSLVNDKAYAFDLPEYDPTLESLTVSPEDVIGFRTDREYYAVGMANTVTTATINAAATSSEASIDFGGKDADKVEGGHQVNLDPGLNTVTITVTAGNGIATKEYVIDVGRGTTGRGGWKAQNDLDGLLASGNTFMHGIWGNATTIWVADYATDKLYAYNRDGTADPSKDFDLDPENLFPNGIWSNGQIMWVADPTVKKIFAYMLSDGTRLAARDFSVHGDESVEGEQNVYPLGIWSDNTTMWVYDGNDRNIYAYNLSDGSRDVSKDVIVPSSVGRAYGMWSDGETFWLTKRVLFTALAVDRRTGSRRSNLDIAFPRDIGLTLTEHIWSDGQAIWVTSGAEDKVYAFHLNETPVFSAPEFSDDTASRAVDEAAAGGTNVGDAVTATDADIDMLSYALGGADASSFDIGSATGQITVGADTDLDYETKSSYEVTVTATDPYQGADEITVTINVNNLDEPGTVTLSDTAPTAGDCGDSQRQGPRRRGDGHDVAVGQLRRRQHVERDHRGHGGIVHPRRHGRGGSNCEPRPATPTTRAAARQLPRRPGRWARRRQRCR